MDNMERKRKQPQSKTVSDISTCSIPSNEGNCSHEQKKHQSLQVDTALETSEKSENLDARTNELFGMLTKMWQMSWVAPRLVDSVKYLSWTKQPKYELPHSIEEFDRSEDDGYARGLIHGKAGGEEGYWDPITRKRVNVPFASASVVSSRITRRHGNLVMVRDHALEVDLEQESVTNYLIDRLYDIEQNIEVHRTDANSYDCEPVRFIESDKNDTKLVRSWCDHGGDDYFETSNDTNIEIVGGSRKAYVCITRRFKNADYTKYDDVWDGTIYEHEMRVRLANGVLQAIDCIEYDEQELKLYYWVYSPFTAKKYMIDLTYWDAYLLEFVLKRNPLPVELARKIQTFLWGE